MTARRAKLEDTGSSDVPNDNYTRDESHRLLTYLMSPTARVTVLTNEGTKGISSTVMPVSELVRIAQGKPNHRKLYEPLDSGIWIRVRIDTVRELDQQYKPWRFDEEFGRRRGRSRPSGAVRAVAGRSSATRRGRTCWSGGVSGASSGPAEFHIRQLLPGVTASG